MVFTQSDLHKTCDEKPIHAATRGPVIRAGAYGAGWQDGLGQARHFIGADRIKPKAKRGRFAQMRFAFFGLQGTGGEDQPPARRQHPGGSGLDITRALQPSHIRMAADGAGGGAGSIQQNGIKGRGGAKLCRIGGDDFRRQLEPRKIFTQPARRLWIFR
jgi:hypothetical protein